MAKPHKGVTAQNRRRARRGGPSRMLPRMVQAQRVAIPVVKPHADRGILSQYALDRAAWVWHPDAVDGQLAVVRFTLAVDLPGELTTRVHLSADQRFEWFVDGQRIGMGPDRSDLAHWSFHSYDLALSAGRHEIVVVAWWLGGLAPVAQVGWRAGFVFAAQDAAMAEVFDTGRAPWRVQRSANQSFARKPMPGQYHVIGPQQTIDGARPAWGDAVEPVVVGPGVAGNGTGIMAEGWRLWPSALPGMVDEPRRAAAVRAAGVCEQGEADGPGLEPVAPTAGEDAALEPWLALVDGGAVEVPAGQTRWAVLDLGDYFCGFGTAALAGSGRVSIEWAEALYRAGEAGGGGHKDDRAQVVGKSFFGFGDTFVAGPHQRDFAGHWWRSGRFLRVTAAAGEKPLVIESLGFRETRYPLEDESAWSSDDAALDAVMPIALRGLQMCMHELYVDCPYYEQMMYVGDTRVQMLINHVVSGDDRLVRRGVELFGWSRAKTGIVAERYPSDPFQLSTTFAMIWPLMVRDYALYRDDPGWVADRMRGVRSLLDEVLGLRGGDGLLGRLPGWSFVDWVVGRGWVRGTPPGAEAGEASSLLNLHLMLSLRAAAELEGWQGETALAARYTALADELAGAITRRFWRAEQHLLADADGEHFSEHAQCLALLTDTLPAADRAACFAALTTRDDLTRTTVYFSHYLLETLHRFGRGDLILDRLAFWKALPGQGFCTVVEKPEPSRSDCHAWGSHPLFHAHASLAGVRPTGPGFARLEVRPTPGPLRAFTSRTPHPRGRVVVDVSPSEGGRCRAAVEIPTGVEGVFMDGDRRERIGPGRVNTFAFAPR